MSDFKSKLPTLKELGSMTGKLFTDLKTSVTEIVDDYKKNRAENENVTPAAQETKSETPAEQPATEKESVAKPAAPPTPVEATEVEEKKDPAKPKAKKPAAKKSAEE